MYDQKEYFLGYSLVFAFLILGMLVVCIPRPRKSEYLTAEQEAKAKQKRLKEKKQAKSQKKAAKKKKLKAKSIAKKTKAKK